MVSPNFHDAPQWLTKNYVEKVLQKYFKDNTVEVKNLLITPATAKGEGYSSVMTRVKSEYTVKNYPDVKEIYFIAKTTHENNAYIANVMQGYDVFNTEMQIYENVMPQLQNLLDEIGDREQLFAKTIHVDHKNNGILFEDLSVRKFVMADRLRGMDETHVKLCLRKLAKWHAVSAVLNERQSGSLEKFDHGILNRHFNGLGPIFENVLEACANFCGTCPELGKYYRDKLMHLKPLVVEYATRGFEASPQHFLTLNHGDFWTNNVMLQYDNEGDTANKSIKDILLIDFQYCHWSSPAVDLHYFLHTSLQDDLLLENHQPKLIQYYHRVLAETLYKLNYKQHLPSLHELHIQLKERGFMGATALLIQLPIMINDKTDDANFESLLGNDAKSKRFHNVLYTNERLQRIVKEMLPKLDNIGLLEVVQ